MMVSVIINCHNEGLLLRASLDSAIRCIELSQLEGGCELICVADKVNKTTRQVLTAYQTRLNCTIDTDFGDLGLARNAGVQAASGELILFLDGDDLWSRNWIKAAWAEYVTLPPEAILHPQCCVLFGARTELLVHPDWRDGYFDPRGLGARNHWISLCGLRRDVALDTPFPAVDHDSGFGFEDWSWYRRTIAKGLLHAVVPMTTHFVRLKEGRSLQKAVARYDCIPSLEFAEYLAADNASRPHDL